jgi:hypothetical protein
MSERIDITAELHGTEQVNAGFQSMASTAESSFKRLRTTQLDLFGQPLKDTQQMSMNMRELSRDVTIFGTAASSLATTASAFGVLNAEQTKVIHGMASFLTLGGYIIRIMDLMTAKEGALAAAQVTRTATTVASTLADWAATAAAYAKAVALAIVNSLSPVGWGILAGAAVAAASGLALANQIPQRHSGGPVYQSGPHNLLAGEYVLSREQVNNVRNMGGVTINVYGGSTENVLSALRRCGAA